jgi:outer membrane protein insertion porin family
MVGFALAATPTPQVVVAVDLVSPHELPQALIRSAIGDLIGRPRSRHEIRRALDRLWSLGILADARVEEEAVPGGLRLRFHLTRRPYLRRLEWRGDAGLSTAELAVAAGLPLGGETSPERLEEARRRLVALYAREGYFAATVTVEAQTEPATNARDVRLVLNAGPRAEIAVVHLGGTFRTPGEEIQRSLGLEGKFYRERTVSERTRVAEERLRDEGYYEASLTALPPVWDPETGTVSLTIVLEEGPRYRLEFEGAEALRESRLRDRLTFREAGRADDFEIASSARQIERAYREDGYAFVQVAGSLTQEPDGPVVRFEITEGSRVTVEAVTFSGNQAIPAERLQEQIQTRSPGLLRSGRFRQDLLDQDLRVLTAFYRSQGFPDVAVGPATLQFSENRERLRVEIPIVEGSRLVVGTVRIEGTRAVSPQELLAAIPLSPGTGWSEERVRESQRRMQQEYARRGFLGPQIVAESVQRDTTMDILFGVEEGIQSRVGRILLRGLVETRETVVRRELPFRPGDPLNPEDLLLAEHRLARLGLFESVEVAPLPSPVPAFADVELRLREGRPWRVDFGGGYSTDEFWRGFVELGHDNLFGTGRSASVREQVTSDGDRTDLAFRSPWILETPWNGDVTLFREQKQEQGYFRQEAGGAVGAQRHLLDAAVFGHQFAGDRLLSDRVRGLRGGLRYRLNWVKRSDVDPTLADADVVPGSQTVASVITSLTLDLRDRLLDPRRGSLHTLSVELGGPFVGGEVSFVKSQVETAWFFDWLSPTVLAVAGRLGLAAPFGDTPDLAIEDRFKAGGATTIRGYPRDKVGPLSPAGNPAGGNARAILNAEWRIPVTRWLSVAAFVDTGAVTPEVGDLDSATFKTGVGGGVRVNTPIGPLRFDAGYALNRIPGEARWQLYFTIGHAF